MSAAYVFIITKAVVEAPNPDSTVPPMIGWLNQGWFWGIECNNNNPLMFPLPPDNPGLGQIISWGGSYGPYYSIGDDNKAYLVASKGGQLISICSSSFSPGHYELTLTYNADGSISLAQSGS